MRRKAFICIITAAIAAYAWTQNAAEPLENSKNDAAKHGSITEQQSNQTPSSSQAQKTDQRTTSNSSRTQTMEMRTGMADARSVKAWSDVHSEAATAISQGKSPDDKVSDMVFENYVKATHTSQHVTNQGEFSRQATYRDMLKASEASLAKQGVLVHVVVAASPDECLVSYRPFLDNDVSDAGMTTVNMRLPPKYYVFMCECQTPVAPMKVDCTTDRTVKFMCAKKQQHKKPLSEKKKQ